MTDDEARRAVARRLRHLSDRLASDDLPEGGWDAVAASLDAVVGRLPARAPADTRFARGHRGSVDGTVDIDDPSSVHPLGTATSGVYPPLDLRHEGDRLVALVAFGAAWEGPPGLVHGGFLAAGFDIVLSAMAHHRLGTSVTRSLRVRYLKPTRLDQALRFEVEAGDLEGRLLDLRGTLYADDRVTMRATAQFATLTADRFADRRRADARPADPA